MSEHYQNAQYEQALSLASRARDLAEQHFGKRHPRFATVLNDLAAVYYGMGQYAAAKPLYQQALEIRRGLGHMTLALSAFW